MQVPSFDLGRGDLEQRRTPYVPYLEGPHEPKHEDLPTRLTHYLQLLTG